MKIVINGYFGGFGLSPLAIKRLAELDGKPCYFFTHDNKSHKYIPADMNNINTLFWNAFTVPNPYEVAGSTEKFYEMSMDERAASNERWTAITLSTRPENRTCPKLIQVVEELGEKANGQFAKLRIIEIPDGVDWEIDEYDGSEKVEEKHRSWS